MTGGEAGSPGGQLGKVRVSKGEFSRSTPRKSSGCRIFFSFRGYTVLLLGFRAWKGKVPVRK